MGHFAPEQSCLVKMWFSLSSAQPPLPQRSSTFSTPSRAGAVPTLERCCLTGTRERINVFKLVIMYRVRTVKQILPQPLLLYLRVQLPSTLSLTTECKLNFSQQKPLLCCSLYMSTPSSLVCQVPCAGSSCVISVVFALLVSC